MNVAKKLNITIPTMLLFLICFILAITPVFVIEEDSNVDNCEFKDLEFVYMERTDLSVGDSQNIYVSCVNSDYANNLTLTYHKIGSELKTVFPTMVVDEVALFSLPFTEDAQVGKYLLDNVSWAAEDIGSQALENEKGYSFEVNNNYACEQELPAGIYDISGDGEISESNLLSPDKTQMLLTDHASNFDFGSNGLKVCLDPGHGGSDPGACYGRLQEKWVNLNIADACKERLQSYGVQVVMTRDSDIDVGLQERCDIAKNNGCNLFISFHNNSGGAVGSEVWVQYDGCSWHDEFAYIGSDIARLILNNLHSHFGLTNRGAKDKIWDGRSYPGGSPGDYYAVLYYSRLYEIPGILIEHAFMDGDYNFLCDNNNLIQMGYQDAEAIARYYGLDKTTPHPNVVDASQSSITLKWDKIDKAEKYAVYHVKSTKQGDVYVPVTESLKTNYFVDNNLTLGNDYTYLVQSYVNGKWSPYSQNNYVSWQLLPCPDVSYESVGDGSVRLKWNRIPGTSKYAVAEYKNGKYVTYSLDVKSSTDYFAFDIQDLACQYEHKFLVQGWYDSQQLWSTYNSYFQFPVVPSGHDKPFNVKDTAYVNSVKLTWEKVPGATKYAIAKQNADGSFITYTYNCEDTSYTISGLECSWNYTFLIQAYFDFGYWSSYNPEDLIHTKTLNDPTRPSPEAKVGDGTVTLSWPQIDGASKYAVYKVEGNKFIAYTEDTVNTNYEITNLPNNREHTFLVQAYTNRGWSKFHEGNFVKATPVGPVKPEVSDSISGSHSIKLIWGNVSGATKYAVAVQNDAGSFITYTLDCQNTFYTVSGLQEDKEYKFLVQAFIDGYWSKFKLPDDLYIASTVDTRPVPNAKTGGDGKIVLSWNPVINADKYAIYEVMDSGSYVPINENWQETIYTVSNLANGYFHRFLVQAYVAESWSTISADHFVMAKAEGNIKPFDIVGVPGSRSIELTWGHVPGVARYAIAIKNDSGIYTTYTLNCISEHYIINGLNEDCQYKVLIQACIYGRWSSFIEKDDLKVFKTINTKPTPTAKKSGDGKVTLSWASVQNADKYAVYEVIGKSYKSINENVTSTSFEVSNLANGYFHNFLVQSHVGGSWSSIDSSLFVGDTPEGNIKPYDLDWSGGYKQINLFWSHVSGAEKYAIASKNDDGTYTTYSLNCRDTSYTINEVKPGKIYECVVQVYIMGKWSKFEYPDDFVFASAIDTRPVIDINSPTGDGSVTLKWSIIENAEKYAIYEVMPSGKFRKINESCPSSKTYYYIDDLANGYSHTFLVQSYVFGFWSTFDSSNYASFTPQGTIKPKIKPYEHDINYIVLHWGKVPGAERYAIAKQNADLTFKTYTYYCTDLSYALYLRGGDTYKFLIQAYINGKWSAYIPSEDIFDVTPDRDPLRPRPVVTKVGNGHADLSWTAIPGATKYAIASKNGDGSYTTYSYDCDKTSYSVAGLMGGEYAFLVQSFVNGKYSGYNDGDLVYATVPSSQTLIMSSPRTSIQQMVNYFNASGHSYEYRYANYGAPNIEAFCTICYQEAKDEGVDPAVLFCQAMLETGWLGFGGVVSWNQCNFGGIGATDHDPHPATFSDVRTGLRAQVQHLKAYGSRYGDLVHPLVDPRFHLVTRGICPNVEDLGGHWASGAYYGYAIVASMQKLFTY